MSILVFPDFKIKLTAGAIVSAKYIKYCGNYHSKKRGETDIYIRWWRDFFPKTGNKT